MTTDISLRNKILLSFLSLIIVSSLTTITAVLLATNNSVEESAQEKLTVGRKVFSQLLDMRVSQLFDSAEVLTSDFGFKAAVLDNDKATIISVLNNHRARIGADLLMLASTEGEFVASSDNQNHYSHFPFQSLVTLAKQDGGLSQIVMLSGKLYQILLLPVRAPVISAWAIVGFEIDLVLAKQLKDLTNLEVTFKGLDAQKRNFELTTLTNQDLVFEAMDHDMLHDHGHHHHEWNHVSYGDESYLSTISSLVETKGYHVDAILSASLTQEYAKYSSLKIQMLIIAGLALIFSTCIAFIIARNVTRPLNKLVTAATRISRGDYTGHIDIEGHKRNEVGRLTFSLNQMQSDIAQREEQMHYQAYHDLLTGLANRISLQENLQSFIDLSENERHEVAVVHLNIRDFKQVNDTFGYEAGDRLLVALSQRLISLVSDTDLVARIGADEFILLLRDENESSILGRVTPFLKTVSGTYQVGDLNIPVSFNCGISAFPAHSERTDQLLRMADIALNQARANKQEWQLYQPGEEEKHLKQIRLVNELKQAIVNDGLTMFYQPKLDVKQRKITQVEALIRWIHPELGFISPGEFIGLAEQSGLMPSLTRWVIREVLKEAATWQSQGVDIQMAINLSAHDLVNEDLPDYVRSILQEYSLPTSILILEVTESAMMDNPELALKILNQFKEDGITLAVDDYGTGYSSLSQLKQLPVDELKIDMAFVLKLDQSNYDQAIVQSTIKMGHKLGLTIVAEGVENRASWALLEEWGCDKLQGFYISKPQNAQDFLQWYKSYDIESEYLN